MIGNDEAAPLAELLTANHDAGKKLIREYERELATAPDEERSRVMKNITALVGIYSKALGDPEPLSWFREPPGDTAPPPDDSPWRVACVQ